MTKHIRIVTPHTTPRPTKLDELIGLDVEASITFSHVGLTAGPKSVESVYDEALAAPYVVERCIEAERDGVDAVIVDCMGDPGVDAARDMVAIPVLGPGETSMHVASMLGHRYGVVTISDRVRPIFEKHARVHGTYENLACVRSVDISVLAIAHEHDRLVEALIEQSTAAITNDKADVILLGCTGFLGISEKLKEGLERRGFIVPVINPLRTTAMIAYAMVSVGLAHRFNERESS
ncbi:aspartate/glutamate racemase family protein [Sphingomonas crocodyli]|uniref:Hydrogenase expression protein HupH n=1 Tax=Sphingomonas crocodyli TaxID=1979270 RepID=A0A437M741_9SPHN|nr:aspartate/glutamate racemase family protein [Sphingomonas crocodyli]RVT93469.1 hydrogenase expression protein HupH [Sphingomonas crocodyli]